MLELLELKCCAGAQLLRSLAILCPEREYCYATPGLAIHQTCGSIRRGTLSPRGPEIPGLTLRAGRILATQLRMRMLSLPLLQYLQYDVFIHYSTFRLLAGLITAALKACVLIVRIAISNAITAAITNTHHCMETWYANPCSQPFIA